MDTSFISHNNVPNPTKPKRKGTPIDMSKKNYIQYPTYFLLSKSWTRKAIDADNNWRKFGLFFPIPPF